MSSEHGHHTEMVEKTRNREEKCEDNGLEHDVTTQLARVPCFRNQNDIEVVLEQARHVGFRTNFEIRNRLEHNQYNNKKDPNSKNKLLPLINPSSFLLT